MDNEDRLWDFFRKYSRNGSVRLFGDQFSYYPSRQSGKRKFCHANVSGDLKLISNGIFLEFGILTAGERAGIGIGGVGRAYIQRVLDSYKRGNVKVRDISDVSNGFVSFYSGDHGDLYDTALSIHCKLAP